MESQAKNWLIGGCLERVLGESRVSGSDGHDFWMSQAILTAMSGAGLGAPNPDVGCVIVSKSGRLLASGHTQPWGGLHAETAALDQCRGLDTTGATAYVTLEPCGGRGKQPPCAKALHEAGVRRLVYGCSDPHQKGSGQGLDYLRGQGVEVLKIGGQLARRCHLWHQPFLSRFGQHEDRCVFIGKWAQSLDGHLADADGTSQWISGPGSRRYTHWLRQRYQGILVGMGTLLRDRPSLTVREEFSVLTEEPRQPVRLLWDPKGRLARLGSELSREVAPVLANWGQTLWLTAADSIPPWLHQLGEAGQLLQVKLSEEAPLQSLATQIRSSYIEGFLGKPLRSVLVEGGARTLREFRRHELLAFNHVFIVPFILGAGPYGLESSQIKLNDARRATVLAQAQIENDLLMEVTSL